MPHPTKPATLPPIAANLPELLNSQRTLELNGLSGSAPALVISQLSESCDSTIFAVTTDQESANQLSSELCYFGVPNLSSFPEWEGTPFTESSPPPDLSGARLETLARLAQGDKLVVVTPIGAIMQKVLPRSTVTEVATTIAVGCDLDRDRLLGSLIKMGYANTPLVEEKGSFAVRGGIIDIFSPSMQHPVRIELFGDCVETIRSFDPLSQRSISQLERLELLPSKEIILSPDNMQQFLKRLKDRADQLDMPANRRRELVELLQADIYPSGIEYLLPIFHQKLDSLLDYSSNPLIVLMDSEKLKSKASEFDREVELGAAKASAAERLFPEPGSLYTPSSELFQTLYTHRLIEIQSLDIQAPQEEKSRLTIRCETNSDVKIRVTEDSNAIRQLAERIKSWHASGWKTIIACHQPTQAERLENLLQPYSISHAFVKEADFNSHLIAAASHQAVIGIGDISRGFRLPEQRIALIAEEELFGKRTRRKSGVSALRTKQIMASMAELKPGDPMVHIDHGIGIYRGLQHLKMGAIEGDFLLLEYAGSDKLYLPIDRLGLVQRYSGGEGTQPAPAKLGGTGWEKTRSRAKKAVEELAVELLEIYAKRQAAHGFSFSPPDELYREFEATFPWEETPDQLSAINDVLSDMQHSRPMDRLICGDVGYGKTEVALRGAFKSVLDGKQVALLVPTTILAQQHFETFASRLKGYPVTIEMLSRFRSAAEQKQILARVAKGEVDIVIGTHRLLQNDVSFKDLGLLIVDEEQRFGVKDKDRLKKYRASVDIMTLTATPIPRTLHMSMMGIRDLSIIDTPPVDRQAIRTVVARDNDELVRNAIIHEFSRDGQVFFVHNRVQSIALVAERLKRLVPEARIAVAHGQMDEKELEKIMLGFMHGKTNLLLCTTIIESGLDIPKANTMIVDRADTYGLSQLYQLRGRIGRSSLRGEAYLLIPGQGSITQDARERLKIIQDITELGAGFRIATHDLELRGAGDLLGPRQSGAVADIGFEYYNQLLEEAIATLKGEEIEDRCEPEINLAIPAFIPESYVPDTNQRLVLYKRLVQAESDDDIRETLTEMQDRYGRWPATIDALSEIMQLRIRLKKLKISKIESDSKKLVLSFHPATPVSPELLISLIRDEPQTYQFTPDHKLLVTLPANATQAQLTNIARSTTERLGATKQS